MAAARSLPSWVVLDRFVRLDVDDEPDWAIMECARRKAIGCGDDGDSVVKGFTLMARLVDPPGLSSLCIRPSYAVLKAIGRVQTAQVLISEQDLIVITISSNNNFSEPYYLIYDATDASLTMTPHLQVSNRHFVTVNSMLPLPFRRGDGSYALVHMATYRTSLRREICSKDLLCLWPSSPSSSSSESSSSSTVPRQLKVPLFPDEMPAPHEIGFSAKHVFSFKGMAFWADLFRGVLYCKHSDLLSDHCDRVQFHFIDLPPGCRPDLNLIDDELPDAFQTMGCAGDSISFVSISYKEALADRKLTMWTLRSYTWEWKKYGELCIGDLWKQQEFKRAGLQASAMLMLPMLSSQEDGVLYVVLPDYYTVDNVYARCREQHILRVDMHGKRLLSSRRLPSWDHLRVLRIVGSNFFKHFDSRHLCPVALPAREEVLTDVLKRKKPSRWSG